MAQDIIKDQIWQLYQVEQRPITYERILVYVESGTYDTINRKALRRAKKYNTSTYVIPQPD